MMMIVSLLIPINVRNSFLYKMCNNIITFCFLFLFLYLFHFFFSCVRQKRRRLNWSKKKKKGKINKKACILWIGCIAWSNHFICQSSFISAIAHVICAAIYLEYWNVLLFNIYYIDFVYSEKKKIGKINSRADKCINNRHCPNKTHHQFEFKQIANSGEIWALNVYIPIIHVFIAHWQLHI